jgi:CubicO group peptidase (beta-lactamase class C family)
VNRFRLDPDRIRDTGAALVEEHHLPGLALGVVHGDQTVYTEGFGFADIETRRPYAPELRQRIGSITKTMVGLCVMALVDEGRLSLDAPVTELLPDIRFHGPAEALTVRHLLTHTGGIGEAPNLPDLKRPFSYLFPEEKTDLAVAEMYPDGITIEVPPGTRWAYANHGYTLLGEIVSRAEKAPIADVVRARVWEPLGMTATDLDDARHPDLSTGYQQAADDEQRRFLEQIGVRRASPWTGSTCAASTCTCGRTAPPARCNPACRTCAATPRRCCAGRAASCAWRRSRRW